MIVKWLYRNFLEIFSNFFFGSCEKMRFKFMLITFSFISPTMVRLVGWLVGEGILFHFRSMIFLVFCRCGPCKVIAPKFQELAKKYSDVIFLKLDCNQENKVFSFVL